MLPRGGAKQFAGSNPQNSVSITAINPSETLVRRRIMRRIYASGLSGEYVSRRDDEDNARQELFRRSLCGRKPCHNHACFPENFIPALIKQERGPCVIYTVFHSSGRVRIKWNFELGLIAWPVFSKHCSPSLVYYTIVNNSLLTMNLREF